MKIFVFSSFLFLSAFSSVDIVVVATSDIQWKEQLSLSNVKLLQANKDFNCKKYLDLDKVKTRKYRASHYILKDRPICFEDAYIPKSNKIKFNFGSIVIEKEGEVIRETDKYIKIKNLDGKIEKIYKDERGQ